MNKFRNTKQREYIYDYIMIVKTHPTASEIYDKIKVQFPNLSLGTVYRNLSILVEQKKIAKLDFGSTFDHYDGNCEIHSHFVCSNCNSVYDLEFSNYNLEQVQMTTTHKIEGCLVKYYGQCTDCKRKSEREN